MSDLPPWEIDPNPQHHVEDPTCTFWIQATPGTTYWRCTIPAKELGGQAISLCPDDVIHHEDGAKQFPRQKGPAVWQFPGNRTRGMFMQEMRRQGIPVFVEVDDNYTVPSQVAPGTLSPWRATNPVDQPEATSRYTHREIVRHACDGVIVSTLHLADTYSHLHENVHVCPNSVDPDDWVGIDKPDDGVFRIGYAFSSSHHYDWEFILDSLEFAASQSGVEVVLIGLVPDFAALKRFKYVNVPWANSLESYRKNLGLLDLGLAPIKSSSWSDARSDIKVMEYAMAGAAAIASPTESYKGWTDGPCLMPLQNRAKDWLKLVKWVLKNRDYIPELAANAKEYVLAERTIQKGAECWREAFASVGALV